MDQPAKVDPEYPGTAVERMENIRSAVRSLSQSDLNADWDDVRIRILGAGGLKDLRSARPGEGYTGHSFNDYNHVDLCAMNIEEQHNDNLGKVRGIAHHNRLGKGITNARLEEFGPGGSWSTCQMGCNSDPPRDVAHLQFKSRIAFKLVWVPPKFESFVLIDDSGDLLNSGTPTGRLPSLNERQMNFKCVQGSKYATEAFKREN